MKYIFNVYKEIKFEERISKLEQRPENNSAKE